MASEVVNVVPSLSGWLKLSIHRLDGRPLPLYLADGYAYVEGEPDLPFYLRILNMTRGELEVSPNMDGKSTMYNRTAGSNVPGMVIPGFPFAWDLKGYGVNKLDGFKFARTFSDTMVVRAAPFSPDLSKMGTIELAAWADTPDVRVMGKWDPNWFAGGELESADEHQCLDFGTLHRTSKSPVGAVGVGSTGKITHQATGETSFFRVGEPDTLQVYIRSRAWLEANRIIVPVRKHDWQHPSSFDGGSDYL